MLLKWMALLAGIVLAAAGLIAGCQESRTLDVPQDRPPMQVEVSVCGETLQAQSRQETVGQLLYRLGLPVSGEYRVSEKLSAPVSDGMRLQVDWLTNRMEVYLLPKPFETLYCSDPSLPAGEQQVLFPGEEGQLRTVVEVLCVNGRAYRYQVLEQTLIAEPVPQIVAVGTGEQAGSARRWPLLGENFIVLESGQVLPLASADAPTAHFSE